ncbi:Bifunctional DNA primase/polymerase, N-terminal [Phyllobacterium sp. CL33Tsu]|uniref:DUF3631 domain-containing protein n=1 Tax=Phyllobacterium sp. CL33Tsu TaxID=1798191 RepID=UPI0008DF3DAB|nr:DUF3631 domain-containing protein [Phyllobacterium sp. CL33Tsu]SFJ15154.1 Bifunctional DNA primase/polymerase, N-terminal [Phyllobacterium sp. CL33Tsu]
MIPLDLALSYASQGFTVLPVNPVNKHALTKNWTNATANGVPGSSKDPDQVRTWWEQWPNACIGLRTGKINGFVVVDIDKHGLSDGFKTIKAFEDVDPNSTATVLTAGDGNHIYYSYAGELKSMTLGEGVDFLAEGRMVIAPGSVRSDGRHYQFVNGRDLTTLAPLPNSVLARLKRSAGQKQLDTWSAKIEATREGDRHNVVRDASWALAHEVVNGRLDEGEFRQRIVDMAGTCLPPLDGLDTKNLIESALRKARDPKVDSRKDVRFTLPDFEPIEEPVQAAELLVGIGTALQTYVSICGDQIVAAALWIVHTHCIEATDYTPRLLIRSPTKRCGKSTLLRIIGKLVRRPLPLSGLTAAMLFRSIAAFSPTLLLDEADNAGLTHNEELRAVFNEGVYREAVIGRTVGDDHEPKLFPIFAPAVLAGIGNLPATLMDRSVIIEMRRKLKSENKERFDRRRIDHLTALGRKAARFAADNMPALSAADPEVPESLNDRELDGWRPLLAIADLAGAAWGERARTAAVNLCGLADDNDDEEPALTLLADCFRIFEDLKSRGRAGYEPDLTSGVEAEIPSVELMQQLHMLEDRPWSEWGRMRKPITQHAIARLLRPYDIRPGNVGSRQSRAKGYLWAAFDDAWKRYGGRP